MTSGTRDRLAELEHTLCGIYAEVLGVRHVGPHDGFFDVGGDSVLALQVVARARQAGLGLSVRDVFDHQSVARLATVVAEPPAGAQPVAAATAGPLVELSQDLLDEFEDDGEQFGEQATDGETGWETDT
jgi:Phosphopantetheine attachment site